MNDKIFTLSVTTDEDSVVQTGSVENLVSEYFGEYEEALEYLKEECLKFIKENK